MLVVRMQRTGRKGHAQFRVVVQDSRRTPTSGKIVAALGSYDPHTKKAQIDTAKALTYISNGAQPTPRVVRLLTAEGVKLPKWVEQASKKEGKLRNPEKLRRNQPKETPKEAPEATPKEEAPADEPEAVEAPVAEETAEAPVEAAAPAETPEA